MKRIFPAIAGLCLCATAAPLWAQATSSQEMPPPKILVIAREVGKFGRNAAHQRNEAAYVQAAMAGKDPGHYLAITSMSGPGEAWFLTPFDSFDAMEKANKYVAEHASLQAKYDQVMEADSQFVNEGNQVVGMYNEKASYHATVNIATMRYFEVETIRYRAGHDAEWAELGKLFIDGLDKAHVDAHFAFYDVLYGAQAGTVLVFTPHKSLNEIDIAYGHDYPAFEAAIGPEGQKRLQELLSNTIVSDVTNVFAFDPKMSYPTDAWIAADPYWKPKSSMAAAPASGGGTTKSAKAQTPTSKPQ